MAALTDVVLSRSIPLGARAWRQGLAPGRALGNAPRPAAALWQNGKSPSPGASPIFRYLKAIRSVRLSVEALSFRGSFAAFELC
jgi:hypothetical protein